MEAPIARTLCFAKRDDPVHKLERPYTHNYFPPKGIARTNVTQESVHGIEIRDLRQSDLTWEKHGIAVTNFDCSLQYEDYENDDLVSTVFLSEARDCLRKFLGTDDVYLVEYTIRRRSPTFPMVKSDSNAFKQPARGAHVDYTAADVEGRIRHAFDDKAEARLANDYIMLNLWKPLNGPLKDWPLAFCDPLTLDVNKDTLVIDSIDIYSHGEAINIHHSTKQQWYYLSDQRPDEATIFKGYDTRQPSRCGVPHAAFDLKAEKQEEISARESIEIRAIAFYKKD